jgi:hypothetical protein
MLKQVLIWPRPVKRAVVMTVDVILAVLATWCAYSAFIAPSFATPGSTLFIQPAKPWHSMP